MNGLIKACKYSFITNELGYCGPKNSFKTFSEFIAQPFKEKEKKVVQLLKNFESLFPYIKLISQKNNLEEFDEQAVEAYWLGNELLSEVGSEDLKELILIEFSKPGLLPKRIAERIALKVPYGVNAHHSFHVLHVNFITGKVAPLLKNLSNCLIQWAKVLEPEKNGKLLVKGIELIFENNELKLKEKLKKIDSGFVSGANEKDFISVHWNNAVELISKKQLQNLQKFTFKNLEAVNKK